MFIPEKIDRALFIPPSTRKVVLRSASGIEDLVSVVETSWRRAHR